VSVLERLRTELAEEGRHLVLAMASSMANLYMTLYD
jgi:hypothetical protein